MLCGFLQSRTILLQIDFFKLIDVCVRSKINLQGNHIRVNYRKQEYTPLRTKSGNIHNAPSMTRIAIKATRAQRLTAVHQDQE